MNVGILWEFFMNSELPRSEFPHNQRFLGPHRKDRLLREFCGNGSCFSLLSRDKCNGCPASSVSWINHLRVCKKSLENL